MIGFSMKNKVIIELKKVSKKYPLRRKRFGLLALLKKQRGQKFIALDEVSLKIYKNENIGVIGHNGSGKTTILKLIAGITQPSGGSIDCLGKVVSLINLEAGLHPELTGFENIMMNGLIVGMTKKEVLSKIDSIVDFAELGKFIFEPVYTYSDGMKLRLGFSIAVHAQPDILLIDEYLAVGDERFLSKSLGKIQQMLDHGATLVMVSHNLDLLEKNSSRVIWIKDGKVFKDGSPKTVVNAYRKFARRKPDES